MSQFFIDVGKIKLTWTGNWSNSTDYVVDDLVWYDDGSTVSSYICVAGHTNQPPSVTGTVDTNYWNLFAAGGLAGGLQPGGTASNQIQYKNGLSLGGETAFTYDPSTDLMTVPSIAVTGTSTTYDVDVTGSVRATAFFEGANQLTFNIAAEQVTSGTVSNARLPATISVTDLAASTSLAVKTNGLVFDSTTDRVGIGTSVPATRLDVRSTSSAGNDDIVARFRSDHSTANGTYIEVMPNTSAAQKSGIHLHKNSLRTDPFTMENDGGAVTFDNKHTSAPSIDFDLIGANKLQITESMTTINTPFRINGCFDEANVSAAIDGSGNLNIDATTGSVFSVTRNDIITAFNITLPAGARAVSLTFVMTSNGSYNVAWPANTAWAGGTSPTMTSTAGRIDVITLSTFNGGSNWLGFVGGTDFQ